METSRVTVVPLSAFGPDREVALLSSVGLDMNIEECTSATMDTDDLQCPLEIVLNERKVVHSWWNVNTQRYETDGGYTPHDLAVVYLAGSDSPRKKTSNESSPKSLFDGITFQPSSSAIPFIVLGS